jgi:thiol-disulfide isomerase/thioredoxin
MAPGAMPKLKMKIFAAVLALGVSFGAGAFDLTDTAGKRHRLADYKGRWVVLNYWATWCVPCIQEIPEIAAFQRERKDVVVLGIAMDAEDVPKTKAFAKKVGHDYALVISTPRVEKQLAPVHGLPTTRVFDPAGKIVYDRLGRVTHKSLNELTTPTSPGKP